MCVCEFLHIYLSIYLSIYQIIYEIILLFFTEYHSSLLHVWGLTYTAGIEFWAKNF